MEMARAALPGALDLLDGEKGLEVITRHVGHAGGASQQTDCISVQHNAGRDALYASIDALSSFWYILASK